MRVIGVGEGTFQILASAEGATLLQDTVDF